MAVKKIGILTGGGDVPGLNAVIKSVVYGARNHGLEVVGIRRGWKGLVAPTWDNGRDDEYFLDLNRQNTRTIDRTGGTFLHTSRTKPSKTKVDAVPEHLKSRLGDFKEVSPGVVDLTPVVLENLEKLGVDYLVPIGGDDTLSYADRLNNEGFPMVCVPKTMDNDVRNTEYCIGFSTALTRAIDAIGRQRTTIGSHERVGVFRIFGRDAGFTALYTAYVTNLRCAIPEHAFDLDKMIELLVTDKHNNPSNYSMVVLSEGATWIGRETAEYGEADAYGHRKKVNVGEHFSEELKRRAGLETVVSDLTYDLRGGEPDFFDKMVATTFATMAVESIVDGLRGKMMGIQKGCFAVADLPDASKGPRSVDTTTMYNIERYRPDYSRKAGLPVFLTTAF
ncbi:MAG: ATP-dependent 6-phosphofructokinase [Acidobacteria bacterium]|nr:ATP-dependent 6-phosphofructokinase [Acidobacteriota bacterium]